MSAPCGGSPAPARRRCGGAGQWRHRGRTHCVWLTCAGETCAELAAGFGIGATTAWRYVNETVALLAARAPKLRTAVRDAKKKGHAYVVVDGTLIPIDRVAADRPFYSGKHKPDSQKEASSAAAPGVPASSPRPSTHCRSARQRQDEKGSLGLPPVQ
jgi:hypothetical protein